MSSNHSADYDVIAVGAGFAGISLSYHLREAALTSRYLIGPAMWAALGHGTNTPGRHRQRVLLLLLNLFKRGAARVVLEQTLLGLGRDTELPEIYRGQVFTWPMFQLNTEVESAEFDNETGLWNVRNQGGGTHTAKYFVSAMGMISQPVLPNIDGQTALTVRSSTPPDGQKASTWRASASASLVRVPPRYKCCPRSRKPPRRSRYSSAHPIQSPAMQKDMTPEWEKEIKDNYDEIIAKARNHMFGMVFEQPGAMPSIPRRKRFNASLKSTGTALPLGIRNLRRPAG